MRVFLLSCLCCLLFATSIHANEELPPAMNIRILETTDLHSHILSFDYRSGKPTGEFGFARTATLIKNARQEQRNVLLFDNGDLLQGSALAEYAEKVYELDPDFVHPAFKALNRMRYDAATLGNHEFNFGLHFLNRSLRGADFPYVNANIYVDDGDDIAINDINYFPPYVLLKRRFVDSMGVEHPITIGVMGLLTPVAGKWDARHMKGKMKFKSMVNTANYFVPRMKSEGADLIVVLAHAGLAADGEVLNKRENSVMALTEVKGIDAILYGHTHSLFPNDDAFLSQSDAINLEKGTVHEVTLVQAGYWGNHLGVIDLTLRKMNEGWKVVDTHSEVRSVFKKENGEKVAAVQEDPDILEALKKDHEHTLNYLQHIKRNGGQ